MIRFDNVCKRYPEGKDALQGVSFHLHSGAMAFLTGHSGAGKSTLLKLVALLERTTRGQLFLDGENLSRTPKRRIPYIRRKIGMIFQNYRLLFDRTVFDNVALPLVIAGYRHQDIGRRVRAALDKVGLLDRERAFPIMLSGGEQQRVGIARAVVNKPPLLLADEPTGNLDSHMGAEIMDILKGLNETEKTTIVMVTHNRRLADQCHRIIRLFDGRRIS